MNTAPLTRVILACMPAPRGRDVFWGMGCPTEFCGYFDAPGHRIRRGVLPIVPVDL
jgi:hypothetical protein